MHLVSKYFLISIILFINVVLVYSSFDKKEDAILKKLYEDNPLIDDDITPYCDNLTYSEYSDLTFRDIKVLEINVPNSGQWYENLIKLSLNNVGFITDEYKESFPAKINLVLKSEKKCEFDAEIRIHGDWKDHIDVDNLTSSLDVSLHDGNILGVTKFKLFLPETRNDKNEIFVTTILRNLDFISPRTGYLNVKTNNGSVQKNIFQEKVAKESIENHGFREGPLIRTEGYYFWRNDEISIEESKNAFVYTKLINSAWGNRSIENFSISIKAIEKYNKAIYSSPNRTEINKAHLSRGSQNISKFDAAVLALHGGHALDHANRKFYFNVISDEFLPIYWDGESDFIESKEISFIDKEFTRIDKRNLKDISEGALSLINNSQLEVEKIKIDLLNKNFSITSQEIEELISRFYENLHQLRKIPENEFPIKPINQQLDITTNKNVNLVFINPDNMTAEICSQDLNDCTIKKNFDTEQLDFDGFKYNSLNSHIFGINKNSLLSNEDFRENVLVDNFYLETFNDPYIKIDFSEKTLEIFLDNAEQKVLISGPGEISKWKIIINSSPDLSLISRQDDNLLTGCLTLYNLKLDSIDIESSNGFCEDAINIINSHGHIDEIKIQNSAFDALDIDYSFLEIKKISISESGNDCLDLSGGNYKILSAYLFVCEDKGISIGEKSKTIINQADVKESFIGIAVKDSSKVLAEDMNFDKTEMCFALYRKKQEFGPSFLSIKNLQCKSSYESYVQKGSEFINEN